LEQWTISGGIWINGTWNNGIPNCDNEPSYWLDGRWNGGDFENGIWYSGVFEEKILYLDSVQWLIIAEPQFGSLDNG
jgi:hypothetical protein